MKNNPKNIEEWVTVGQYSSKDSPGLGKLQIAYKKENIASNVSTSVDGIVFLQINVQTVVNDVIKPDTSEDTEEDPNKN